MDGKANRLIPECSHLFWANVHPGTAPLTSDQPRAARWGSPAESKPIPCAQDAALRRSLGAVTDVWHRYHFMDEGAKGTLKRIRVVCEHRKHVGLTPLHSPGLVDEGRWPHYRPNCGNKDHSAPPRACSCTDGYKHQAGVLRCTTPHQTWAPAPDGVIYPHQCLPERVALGAWEPGDAN